MRVASCLIALLLGTGTVPGQTEEPEVGLPRVYVRESFEAPERLEHLRELEAAGQWGQAAEECDRLVAELGEQLVQVDSLHYRNVMEYVGERRLRWPAAAQRRYEELFAARAAGEVGRLGPGAPAGLWTTLAERYWPTAAGREAARRAVERLAAEGHVEAAARWSTRLNGGPGGRIDPESAPADWPGWGQGARDGGAATMPAEAMDVLWDVPADRLRDDSLPDMKAGETPAVPVAVGERVCMQVGGRLVAIGLYGGQIEWVFAPRELDGVDGREVVPGERGGLAVSTRGERVFAAFTSCAGDSIGPSLVASIDTVDGYVNWRVAALSEGLSGAFRPVEFFDGPPLVYEGHVYAVIRRRRELGFEDCRLACFDQQTGECGWEVWLASGPRVESSASGMARSGLVGRSGDVFVRTHAGAAACVDGVTGRVRWVTLEPASDEVAGFTDGGSAQANRSARIVTTVDGLTVVSDERGVRCLVPAGAGMELLAARAERNVGSCAAWLDLARYAFLCPASAESARGFEALDRAVACTACMAATTRLDAERAVAREHERALDIVIDVLEEWTSEAEQRDERWVAVLLSRAADLAVEPEQQVRYRLAFADAVERWGNPAEAARLYQEVLDAAGLRGVRRGKELPREEGARKDSLASTSGTAGRLAELSIDELIRRHGRAVYGRLDVAAEEMLRAGLELQDGVRLRHVVERYPNSDHAGEALVAWVKLERAAGRPLGAARFAEDFVRRRADVTAKLKAEIVAQIAAAYFEAGDPVGGWSWLNHGQREYAGEQWSEEGQPVTFASLRQRLRAARVEPLGGWPGVTPPLHRAYELERPNAVLLCPREQATNREDCAGAGLVLLFAEGRVEALNPMTGASLWDVLAVSLGAPMWLGTRGDVLILATPYQLFALDRNDGAIRWSVGQRPRLAMSSAIDPEVLTRIASLALGQTLIVAATTDGRCMAVEIGSGEVLWERALPRRAGDAIALNSVHAAYMAQGEPAALIVLAAADGGQVAEFAIDDGGGECSCAFMPDGTLLVADADSVACFDPYTKARRWNVSGPRARRSGSLLMGTDGYYLSCDRAIQCRSYADGDVLWERPLDGTVGGAVVETWLDAGRVYVLAGGGAAVLDARVGEVIGFSGWEQNVSVGPAWLTLRHILVSGSGRSDAADGLARWELGLHWVPRAAGPHERAGGQSLGSYPAAPDVVVCGQTVIVRAGSKIVAWTGEAGLSPVRR